MSEKKSTNEVIVKSGRATPVGGEWWELRDDAVSVHYVDMITELRHHNTVVYLSMGSAVVDAGNNPLVVMACRLRMDIGTAQSLHKYLGDAINEALSTPDKSTAN